MKKMILGMILGLALILCASGVRAEEKPEFKELRLTSVRQERVNLLAYTESGLDFVSEIIARLIKTGKPSVLFAEETKAALEVSLVEKFLGENVDLIGGMTLKNEAPSNFIWGLQYTGLRAKTGGIWEILSKLNPTIYNERGRWWLGAAYVWREET